MPFRKCEKTCLVSCLKEEQRSIAPKCLLLSKAPTQTINRLFRAVRRACGCSKRHLKKRAPEKFLFSCLGAGTSTAPARGIASISKGQPLAARLYSTSRTASVTNFSVLKFSATPCLPLSCLPLPANESPWPFEASALAKQGGFPSLRNRFHHSAQHEKTEIQ